MLKGAEQVWLPGSLKLSLTLQTGGLVFLLFVVSLFHCINFHKPTTTQ